MKQVVRKNGFVYLLPFENKASKEEPIRLSEGDRQLKTNVKEDSEGVTASQLLASNLGLPVEKNDTDQQFSGIREKIKNELVRGVQENKFFRMPAVFIF